MPDAVLRWGLLSTARINRDLIPPLQASKRNELAAVASRSRDRAEAYARQWRIPRAHGSYEAMLADPEIDVIYNPLPNHLHAEWSIKALRAGKHVLCEKPIALTLAEMDSMIAAARETGRILAEAFMYRHHPQTLRVKQLLESGRLGTLRLIRGAFTFMLSDPRDIRTVPEMGGGSLWDVGCYPVSYARMLVGSEPLEVFGWQAAGRTGIDETFAGQMIFTDDVLAQFDCGFKSQLRWQMEIVGSDATLLVPSPFKPGLDEELILTANGRSETIQVRGQELYIGEVEDMADAILRGRQPRVSLEDSRANTAVLLALLESARVGRPRPV